MLQQTINHYLSKYNNLNVDLNNQVKVYVNGISTNDDGNITLGISNLADVQETTPTENQVLTFSSGKWTNKALNVNLSGYATLDSNNKLSTSELPTSVALLGSNNKLLTSELPTSVALLDNTGYLTNSNKLNVDKLIFITSSSWIYSGNNYRCTLDCSVASYYVIDMTFVSSNPGATIYFQNQTIGQNIYLQLINSSTSSLLVYQNGYFYTRTTTCFIYIGINNWTSNAIISNRIIIDKNLDLLLMDTVNSSSIYTTLEIQISETGKCTRLKDTTGYLNVCNITIASLSIMFPDNSNQYNIILSTSKGSYVFCYVFLNNHSYLYLI